eukprot:TRINITY_DN113167_c0_g1_i1.p1 TRINITY_DN113167_c0_g1~~TRINITY_DN113167_c0_g1_i1.p1  ORF type:complete len:497 (+),score=139.32 TRINITY_DN113167_c0_g1_i1:123-1613(+)
MLSTLAAATGDGEAERSSWQSGNRRLLAELEAERLLVQEPLEELRVPVEDAHRAGWECKKRIQEIADLKSQLVVVEDNLRRQQEVLLSLAREREALKAEVPAWEVDLQQLRAVARPRVEGLHFIPGHLPERIGGFTAALGASSRGSSGSNSQRPGPVVTEYLPTDREASVQQRLAGLRERVAVERESRGASRSALEDLMRVEAEEAQLLQQALREQLSRVRKRREKVRAQADNIVEHHLRLKEEVAGAEASAKSERLKLKETGDELTSKLAGTLVLRCEETHNMGKLAQQLQQRSARTHETGMLRAREDAAFLREQIEDEEDRSAQRIAVLEEQLLALRRRYKALEGSRVQELEALRLDIEGLQRATRQCEQLATRCVAWQQGLPMSGSRGDRRLRSASCCSKCNCSCNSEDAKMEALALRPAVARLRKVLENCEHAVLMEEAGGRGQEAPGVLEGGSNAADSIRNRDDQDRHEEEVREKEEETNEPNNVAEQEEK